VGAGSDPPRLTTPRPQDPQRDLLTQGPEDPVKAAFTRARQDLRESRSRSSLPPEVMREFRKRVDHANAVENIATSGIGGRIASYSLGATEAAAEGLVGSVSSFATGVTNTAIDVIDTLLGRKGQITGMTMFGPTKIGRAHV